MSSSSSISFRISSALSPSRITRSGVMPAMAAGARGVFAEFGVGFLARFGAHDVGDAEPLLALIVGFDHPQHDDIAADARRAPAGEINRAVALLGVVDHDEKLRLVTGFVAAAPAWHRISSGRREMLPRRRVVRQAGRR